MKYAEILVNKSKIYTYSIPDKFSTEVGAKVEVPLRGKNKSGYIINFCSMPEFPVKNIINREDDNIYFSESLVKLAEWISKHYKCYFATALKSILPPDK